MIQLVPLLAFLTLAACTQAALRTPPPPAEGAGQCTAAAAQALVGQKATAETGARALALTGAKTLRWGPPRSVFTMDYRADRLNVMYDDALIITELTCG